jgi:hypothetical protein
MAFHKMASGHFAYVINESGNRQLVTEEQFRECCCPAPCSCPCGGTWPPESWPCGGLLETYGMEFSKTISSPSNGDTEYKSDSTITLTASSTSIYLPYTTCLWSKLDASILSRVYNGSVWGEWTATTSPEALAVRAGPPGDCRWAISIRVGFTFLGGSKVVGLDPIGSYITVSGATTTTVTIS